MIKKILATFYVLAISISSLLAQCATCKAAAETSLEDGNTTIASGINLGVIYMLSILFIIFRTHPIYSCISFLNCIKGLRQTLSWWYNLTKNSKVT